MKKKVIICLLVIGLLSTCLCSCVDDTPTLPDIPGVPATQKTQL